MSFIIKEITPGIQLVYKQVLSTRLSHIGVTFNTGSRDEAPEETGLAHLMEHMLFKGTTTRNWRQIINSIELAGGEMNAFTTKEKTSLYASLISDQTHKAIRLLADISLHSVFPEPELEKEKKVISDEIDMYADSPEEMILDEFYEQLFEGHPLGTNILGQKNHILHYSRKALLGFVKKLHLPNHMAVSYAGPVPVEKILKWCASAFGTAGFENSFKTRIPPPPQLPFNIEKTTKHQQCHVVYGNRAFSMHDSRRTLCMFLANILGGPALNSMLNMTLREKNGLTYGVDAAYNYYIDTGVFYIQWTADRENLNQTLKMVKRELRKLMQNPLSEKKLKGYKTQFKGQLIISEESNQGLMLMMGRSYLDYGEVEPLERILAEIDAIDSHQLQTLACELFDPEKMSLLVYKSENGI